MGKNKIFYKSKIPIIIIMRHGASLPNKDFRLYGQVDVLLDSHGYHKIVRGAEIISHLFSETLINQGFDTFMSSDLLRCHETARIIKNKLYHYLDIKTNFITTKALREAYLGSWENALLDDVINEVIPYFDDFDQDPDLATPGNYGESNLMIKMRVLEVLKSRDLYEIQKMNDYYDEHLVHLENLNNFEEWLEEASKLLVDFSLHLFVLHEGSAYAFLNLLNLDCWKQDVRQEFNGIHQNFFTRGDLLFLRPRFTHHNSGLAKIEGWKLHKEDQSEFLLKKAG